MIQKNLLQKSTGATLDFDITPDKIKNIGDKVNVPPLSNKLPNRLNASLTIGADSVINSEKIYSNQAEQIKKLIEAKEKIILELKNPYLSKEKKKNFSESIIWINKKIDSIASKISQEEYQIYKNSLNNFHGDPDLWGIRYGEWK